MSREEFERRAASDFSAERAAQLLALARPAIGLWPQRQSPSATSASSRHGGELWAPAGWQWPICDDEPMYFLGQVRCRELAGLPGAECLPGDGVLAFFGDYDVITGSFPGGDPSQGAVCHWPETGLVPAAPPLPLDTSRPDCATIPLVFHPFIDLPHPFSAIVGGLVLNPEEREQYDRLRRDSRWQGVPADVVNYIDDDSKLLGWPDLVQYEFDLPLADADFHLLAQLPARMGPGGSLYFFIRDADLAQRRFDRAFIHEQNT